MSKKGKNIMAIVSLLAQVADSKASQAANAVSSIMPSGVILPYGGNTAPTGWLECNGQEVSQATYAELFAALGATYNTQLNPVTGSNWAAPSAGNFRVPDMRGMFMRGEGTPSGLDAVTVGGNQVQKTKPNGLLNSGLNTVSGTAAGQTQPTSNISLASGSAATGGGSHSHTTDASRILPYNPNDGFIVPVHSSGSAFVHQLDRPTNSVSIDHTHSVSGTTNIGHTHGASSITATAAAPTISGDNETRPINRGVKYIIKV